MEQWRITSDNSWETPSKLGGYRSRYYAFLEQKANKPSVRLQKLTRFGQGLTSVAIFIALFVGILTLFGVGLSWYSQAYRPKSEMTRPNEAAISGATANMLPPSTEQPGPAEARKKTRK